MSGPLIAKRNGEMITLDFPLNNTQKIVSGDYLFYKCLKTNSTESEWKREQITANELHVIKSIR